MSFNTTTYESYMHALKKGLESFDSALADEIIHDFESHFADARSQGLSDEEICAELGDVNDVLTFFRQEYATTEQPVARTEAKTSNAEGHLSTSTSTGSASQSSSALPDINAQLSQEPQYSYPSDPAASITRMEIVLRNASASFAPGTSACVSFDCTRELDPDRFEVGIDGNTFYLREKKISAAVFWKHFFYTGQKTEKFIFQVPSTVQQITLRSVNGGTELSHLSLEKLEISSTNGKLVCNALTVSDCHLQATNGKLVLTDIQADSLEASATNGKLQASASCSRAVLNGVNGTVLFEGTCKESLQAKSVNGSVNLYLPHGLSDAAVSASTVTGKIRLTEKGNTSSFSRHFTQKSDVSSRTIQASTVNGNVTLSDQPDKD